MLRLLTWEKSLRLIPCIPAQTICTEKGWLLFSSPGSKFKTLKKNLISDCEIRLRLLVFIVVVDNQKKKIISYLYICDNWHCRFGSFLSCHLLLFGYTILHTALEDTMSTVHSKPLFSLFNKIWHKASFGEESSWLFFIKSYVLIFFCRTSHDWLIINLENC